MIKKTILAVLGIIILLMYSCVGWTQEEDSLEVIAEGQYFTIYGYPGMDINGLLTKLNYNYFLQLDTLLDGQSQDLRSILARTADALYSEASDILGIHVYSFHGNLKFYPDQAALNDVFKSYFHEDFPQCAFYLHERATLYVSMPDVTLGMLSHEIAHAIISHYFVIPPPARVQEILCGYIEYSLRKSTGTLP